jgi:hypothetical protein
MSLRSSVSGTPSCPRDTAARRCLRGALEGWRGRPRRLVARMRPLESAARGMPSANRRVTVLETPGARYL